jgi:hypothetical protein
MKLWLCCGIFLELPFGKKKPPHAADHQLFQNTHSDIDPRTGKARYQKDQSSEA